MCGASNGQIYGFGYAFQRQLGIDESNIEQPTALPFFKAVEKWDGNGDGDGDNEYRYRQIECGEFHSGVVDADGNVFLFGYNEYGQIGMGSREIKKMHQPFKITPFKCKQISIGLNHTLMLTENDNEVYACGDNEDNQCFQMADGAECVLSPALYSKEMMGIGDQQKYGDVVRVIAGRFCSIIVVELFIETITSATDN